MRIKGILCLVLLVAIILFILPSETTESNQQSGNTYGNMVNYGLVSQNGEDIFYSNGHDNWKLYHIKKNDTSKRKLTDDSCQYISVSDNSVFYSNTSDGWKIYSVNSDGSNRKKLNDDHSEFINVVGENIYYVDINNGWKITSISKNGTGKKALLQDAATSLNVANDWIYYINLSDNKKIYRAKIDGTGRQKLTDDRARQINLYGDKIYYINERDNGKIYSINLNSSGGYGNTNFFDDNAININVSDGYLYYICANDEHTYKIDLSASSKSRILLREQPTYILNIVDKWIYFCSYYEENYSYIYYDDFLRASKDGKILQGMTEMIDSEKAAEVSVIIGLLPLPAQLKITDMAAVDNARAKYDALTAAQKALVANYSVLTAAEAKIIELGPKEIKSSTLRIDNTKNIISKIEPETSISSVIGKIDAGAGTVEVYDKNGNKVTSGNIGTGYKIRLIFKNNVVDEKTVVVYGDVNGDGKINATDMLAVELHIFGKMSLQGAYYEAASLAKKPSLTATDMLIIELHIFNKSLITQ